MSTRTRNRFSMACLVLVAVSMAGCGDENRQVQETSEMTFEQMAEMIDAEAAQSEEVE